MPEPSSPVDEIPDDFDPDKHCGAKTRGGKPCMNIAGYKTDNPGVGRCFRHGGRSGTLKHGLRSKYMGQRATIQERVSEIQNSPDLLSLDKGIAFIHALLERQIEAADIKMQEFDDAMAQIEELGLDKEDADTLTGALKDQFPSIDVSLVTELSKTVKIAYDMRFSKKFSIPVTELAQVIEQIVGAFDRIARKYGLPHDARVEFAEEMQSLQLSRRVDVQLDRAGGVNSDESDYIEGQVSQPRRSNLLS